MWLSSNKKAIHMAGTKHDNNLWHDEQHLFERYHILHQAFGVHSCISDAIWATTPNKPGPGLGWASRAALALAKPALCTSQTTYIFRFWSAGRYQIFVRFVAPERVCFTSKIPLVVSKTRPQPPATRWSLAKFSRRAWQYYRDSTVTVRDSTWQYVTVHDSRGWGIQ